VYCGRNSAELNVNPAPVCSLTHDTPVSSWILHRNLAAIRVLLNGNSFAGSGGANPGSSNAAKCASPSGSMTIAFGGTSSPSASVTVFGAPSMLSAPPPVAWQPALFRGMIAHCQRPLGVAK
jgi:hypothetical protein